MLTERIPFLSFRIGAGCSGSWCQCFHWISAAESFGSGAAVAHSGLDEGVAEDGGTSTRALAVLASLREQQWRRPAPWTAPATVGTVRWRHPRPQGCTVDSWGGTGRGVPPLHEALVRCGRRGAGSVEGQEGDLRRHRRGWWSPAAPVGLGWRRRRAHHRSAQQRGPLCKKNVELNERNRGG